MCHWPFLLAALTISPMTLRFCLTNGLPLAPLAARILQRPLTCPQVGVPELVVFLNKVDLLAKGDEELQELVEMEVR